MMYLYLTVGVVTLCLMAFVILKKLKTPPKVNVNASGIIRSTKLFDCLTNNHVAALAKLCQVEQLAKGKWLMRQGDSGNCMYIVVSGSLRIDINTSNKREKRIAEKGAILGEMSLVTQSKRHASVKTTSPVVVLKISKDAYDKITGNYPTIRNSIVMNCCWNAFDNAVSGHPQFCALSNNARWNWFQDFTYRELKTDDRVEVPETAKFAMLITGQLVPKQQEVREGRLFDANLLDSMAAIEPSCVVWIKEPEFSGKSQVA